MTHAEKRMITDTARRVEAMHDRLDAMCEIFETLLVRGKGRPTTEEVNRLEQLKARMNASTH